MNMLTPEQRKQLDRIQSLLNKANDKGVTQAESETLTGKAAELATKYMIDQAFIAAGATSTDDIDIIIGQVGRPYNQLITLAHIVYKHFGCKLVRHSQDPAASILQQLDGKAADGTKYHMEKYTVTGFKSDLDCAQMLYASLQMQGQRWAVADYRNKALPGERRSTYYRSWWTAFTNEIFYRLERMKEAATVEANVEHGAGKAEIVLMSRSDLVARAVAERHGKLTHGRKSRGSTGSGYEAGTAAGRRADLGGRSVGASTRAIGK